MNRTSTMTKNTRARIRALEDLSRQYGETLKAVSENRISLPSDKVAEIRGLKTSADNQINFLKGFE